jgi:hypothetical protein
MKNPAKGINLGGIFIAETGRKNRQRKFQRVLDFF